jgi:hypothetical protein
LAAGWQEEVFQASSKIKSTGRSSNWSAGGTDPFFSSVCWNSTSLDSRFERPTTCSTMVVTLCRPSRGKQLGRVEQAHDDIVDVVEKDPFQRCPVLILGDVLEKEENEPLFIEADR